MPSERFLRLNTEKRQRILDAAREEFSRVPYEQVSINRIIREAEISRGSFYTYFEDKEDLLSYIFLEEERGAIQFFKELVLRSEGDFWKSLTEWCRTIAEIEDSFFVRQSMKILTHTDIFRRFFLIHQRKSEQGSRGCMEPSENGWLLEHVSAESVDRRRSPEERELLFKTAIGLGRITLLHIFGRPSEKERQFRELETMLSILRLGFNSGESLGAGGGLAALPESRALGELPENGSAAEQ